MDADRLSKATGQVVAPPCSALCTSQLERAAQAMEGDDTVFCCTQESRVFEALAEEMDRPVPPMLDLRDRAGWTSDDRDTLPKMSALVAEAMLPAAPEKTVDVVSEGLCLILGSGEASVDAATQLAPHLGVTLLLPPGADIPDTRAFDVICGELRRASGALGQFDVVIDGLQQVEPGGRGGFALSDPRDGGQSQCDVILDLRGDTPLFPAHEKREGYLRADPSHAPAVSAAVMAASHLVGTFEKPLYIRSEPLLCAHSRAEQAGCSRCLDLCPTGAITPKGEHVEIDPMVCAGCGACSSVCPSGAISYDAPPVDLIMRRIQTLAKAYLDAGGDAPRLLVHDASGADLIRASARYGRGLPADVIPMELPVLGTFGHAECLAALAAGFGEVILRPGRGTDRDALDQQLELARALAPNPACLRVADTDDPDALEEALWTELPAPGLENPVRPMGSRRQVTRAAARALHPEVETLPLPAGAPYGAVLVDSSACTLCLSCVSLCPSGALGDNPDQPQLRFQEDACLQCGLCANICPENAITLEPQLNLTDSALNQQILHEEEPFACIECGALFGVKSTIERITEKLASHSMFQGEDKLRMIQMCDDCRVSAQFRASDNPFQGGERPMPRTTDDYLSKRRDH